MIRFECPECGKRVKVGDHFAGKTGRCPRCTTTCKIPAAPQSTVVKRVIARLPKRPSRKQLLDPSEIALLRSAIASQRVSKASENFIGGLVALGAVAVLILFLFAAFWSSPGPNGSSGVNYYSVPSASSSMDGPVHVRGYHRKDGPYVRPHTRSYPRH